MYNRPPKSSVEELRRYDPELGVRYSWERRKWAITRKVMPLMWASIPRPVRRIPRRGGGADEVILDPRSELSLNYRNKTEVVGFVRDLNKDAVKEVLRMDGWRRGNDINKRIGNLEMMQEKQREFARKDRVHAAYDFLRSGWRRNPMSY